MRPLTLLPHSPPLPPLDWASLNSSQLAPEWKIALGKLGPQASGGIRQGSRYLGYFSGQCYHWLLLESLEKTSVHK